MIENSYQEYKDRVNFVWVYGWEAHPEEKPFPGTESSDLGWDHTYCDTTTMEERAQRAKWLKTDSDPDWEIPTMIDYINDSPNQDNAIKYAYIGGGFYSGFVIDCDGKVIKKVNWAWYDDGGEWSGLPLEHIDVLHSFLDNYLDNPPECYSTSSSDGDADGDTDGDTDGDADGDTDGDADGDANADTDADADNSSNSNQSSCSFANTSDTSHSLLDLALSLL